MNRASRFRVSSFEGERRAVAARVGVLLLRLLDPAADPKAGGPTWSGAL
jgi:hypothetical protein